MRQKEIRTIYQQFIDNQLATLKQLIVGVWSGKTENCKEVVELSAIVLSAMEGAFLLSALANDVMPKNYASDSVISIIRKGIYS